DREVTNFRGQEHDYQRRGWWLARIEFPQILVRLAAPQVTPVPIAVGVLFDFTNFDVEPPSVRYVHPFTEAPLKLNEVPVPLLLLRVVQSSTHVQATPGVEMVQMQVQPYLQASSPNDVPFICTPGVREYHAHPGHSGDFWDLHRTTAEGSLVSILNLITDYGIRVIGGYNIALVPSPQALIAQTRR
ncbi:MAG: putative metal-binding protein, partial [Solirubrobacteraceae bacterium]